MDPPNIIEPTLYVTPAGYSQLLKLDNFWNAVYRPDDPDHIGYVPADAEHWLAVRIMQSAE